MLLMASAIALAATIDCTRDEPCYGTPQKDTMDGTATTDEMMGRRGDDIMEGLGSTDSLSGQAGDDTMRGDKGGDALDGYFGNDTLYGSTGDDVMRGDDDVGTDEKARADQATRLLVRRVEAHDSRLVDRLLDPDGGRPTASRRHRGSQQPGIQMGRSHVRGAG